MIKTKKLTAYQFIGGGFGHGVGLSQFGSYNLAKLGWTAEKNITILLSRNTSSTFKR